MPVKRAKILHLKTLTMTQYLILAFVEAYFCFLRLVGAKGKGTKSAETSRWEGEGVLQQRQASMLHVCRPWGAAAEREVLPPSRYKVIIDRWRQKMLLFFWCLPCCC